MARPIKPDDVNRSALIRIRVTMAEKEDLTTSAAKIGLTLSDWVRLKTIGVQSLLKQTDPNRDVLIRTLAAFGKTGSNLNQIARQLNRKQGSEEFEVPIRIITNAIEEVREITSQIRNLLQHGGHQRGDQG